MSSKKTDAAADHEQGSERPETATSFWNPSPIPVERERRKDPAAEHRHEQARTGVPPTEAVEQREGEDSPYPASTVPLWDKTDEG